MNRTLFLARGPASQAAHALHDKIDEIAADVRELRAQTNPPPPQAEPGIGENPNPRPERDAGIPVAEPNPSPPIASETAAASLKVAARSETSPAAVRTPAPARERVDLPPQTDLRPELAAFTAAFAQQQAATLHVLRRATEACQHVSREMDRYYAELDRLDRKIQHLTQRM